MTHNKNPTAAPLTAEHIEAFRRYWQEAGADHHTLIGNLCDMALRSLERPVPFDVAEDVNLVRETLGEWADFEDAEAWEAFNRIVAYLSRCSYDGRDMAIAYMDGASQVRDAAASGTARELCAKLIPHTTSVYNVDLVQQAIDQARAEGLKVSASICDGMANDQGLKDGHRLGAELCASQIRGFLPAGRQTKGDGK